MNELRPIRLAFVILFLAALIVPTAFGIYAYLAKPHPAEAKAPVAVAPVAPAAAMAEKKDAGGQDKSPARAAKTPAPGETAKPADSTGPGLWTEIQRFPAAYQSGYNANFPLRPELVVANNSLRIKVFDESPVKGVVLGKNWLYYNTEWAMEDYENLAPFTNEDLDKIIRVLSERTAWLKDRGIPYYVLVAPNSQTIYPEYLPDRFHKLSPLSRLDQLRARLASRPDIALIDPRDALLTAKQVRRTYHRTDTHWNDWGAFNVSGLLLSRIHRDVPAIVPDRLEDSNMEILHTQGGDLAGLLSLEFPEDYPHITPKTPRQAKIVDGSDPGRRLLRGGTLVYETGKPGPKAVVFHDSFFVALMPMLAEHFSRIVYVWNFDFNADLIEREKPDVVILECVERYIYALTLDNPARVASNDK